MEPNDLNRPVKILVIEDNEADIELLRLALEEAGLNFEMTAIEDGGEALACGNQVGPQFEATVPDLIVLDLNLPKYGGLEVLEAVRGYHLFDTVPVVVLSSSSSPRELEKIKAFVFVRFIRKPADLDQCMQIGKLIADFLIESGRTHSRVGT